MKQTEQYKPEEPENESPADGAERGTGDERLNAGEAGDAGEAEEGDRAEFIEKSQEEAEAARQERQEEADEQAEALRKAEEEAQQASERDGEEPVIVIKGLRKAFGDHEVLRGVDMHVKKGENVVILGKSGTGKSVLIKCLVGLEWPDEGEIKMFGKDLLSLKYGELNEVRVRTGFLFQNAQKRYDEGKEGVADHGNAGKCGVGRSGRSVAVEAIGGAEQTDRVGQDADLAAGADVI